VNDGDAVRDVRTESPKIVSHGALGADNAVTGDPASVWSWSALAVITSTKRMQITCK
jgi:hypothetical protein